MGKLTVEQIIAIYEAVGLYKDVAKGFGVSSSCVTHIKTGLRHGDVTGASDNKNMRKRIPCVTKSQAQAVHDYIKDPEDPKTYEEAALYFDLPKYTVRRIMVDYLKKFKIKNEKR